MSLIYLVLGIGLTASVLAIAGYIVVDKMLSSRRRNAPEAQIAKDYFAKPEINPGLILSKLGAQEPAERSLDAMVLRPTWGIKLFGFATCGLLFYVILMPGGAVYRQDMFVWLLIGAIVIYFIAFLMAYEVRYDSEGIIAPGLFFRPQFHPWSKFISIRQSDNVHYKLVFKDGTLKIKKFLVGMPTFLTFVTDIREMNKRL